MREVRECDVVDEQRAAAQQPGILVALDRGAEIPRRHRSWYRPNVFAGRKRECRSAPAPCQPQGGHRAGPRYCQRPVLCPRWPRTRTRAERTRPRDQVMHTSLASGTESRQPAERSPLAVDAKGVSLTFATADGQVRGAVQDRPRRSPPANSSRSSARRAAARPRCLRVIADLEQPTAGTISVNGVTPDEARLKRHYGYVFQAPALYPWRTIERNVMLPLEIMGFPAEERQSAGRALSRARQSLRLRAQVSLAAVRRHAAARLDRARAVVRSGAAADGRAVRRARRDRARPSQRAAAAAVEPDRKDRGVRHPLDSRGGVPVDQDRGDVAAARAASST